MNTHRTAENLEMRTSNGSTHRLPVALAPLLVLAALAVIAAAASGAPTVSITSPAEAATINSGTIVITLDVQNFALNGSAMGMANVAGEGHYHLKLDGALQKMDAQLTTFINDVAEGAHVVTVELASNDHTELGINDTVNVTISSGAPRIKILSPAPSASLPLNFTVVTIWASNFTMVGVGTTMVNVAGTGHWHLSLDGTLVTMESVVKGNISGMSAGSHTIRAEFVNNDHSPLADPVMDEVTVTVVGAKPSITMVTPAAGATINGNTTTVTVTVVNFTLSAAHVGQAPVEGEGHWHVFVDGVYSGFSATNTVSVTNLSVGDHVIKVGLYNNDHSSLPVDFSAQVTVHVAAAAAPSVVITAPPTGTEVTGTTLNLTLTVANFTLVTVGSTSVNVLNSGHIHVLVDGVVVQMVSTASVSLTNLTVGSHTIRAELANNDHSAISGASNSSTITVVVKAATVTPAPKGFLPGFESVWAVAALGAVAAIALVRRRRVA